VLFSRRIYNCASNGKAIASNRLLAIKLDAGILASCAKASCRAAHLMLHSIWLGTVILVRVLHHGVLAALKNAVRGSKLTQAELLEVSLGTRILHTMTSLRASARGTKCHPRDRPTIN
jgi:hypothetical protein